MQDAANDIIDEQVPLELNQSMIADVDFISSSDLDDTTFDIHKTVQKVDDITYGNGETATLYVSAAVATETTLDKGFTEENGIVAHIFVYWIDNLGTVKLTVHSTFTS
ncbi:MAG: hypothetical protein LUG83_06160 [Lachnospiraceae bacterium]|nr:hypothetical protein [Lachnospiraceae bacterium]